ncbi:cupin, partial [Colletotrichum orchidophilum]
AAYPISSRSPVEGCPPSPSPNILQHHSTQTWLLIKRNIQLRPFRLPLSAGGTAETGEITTEHASLPRTTGILDTRSRACVPCRADTMASLIPLINDLIPMIVSSSVSVTKASTLRPPNATLDPASANEADAIVSKSDKLCASDTIVYMASGTGILFVSPGAGQEVKRHELSSGDFAFIPSWTEHQLLNESDQDTVWVITRSGSQPVTVGLTDWGGDRAK